ncbi:MAG TPA: hypothetical protein PKX21_01800 [Candidatus Pacearchaeota archaeon]|nr:hypothetical protein [Candidatus Pacearchaeota archaeon]
MNKQYKIELVIIIVASIAIIAIVFGVYLSRSSDDMPPEAILLDQVQWSEAEDYQLQPTSLGTEIYFKPAEFRMILPDNWNVRIIPIEDTLQGARVDAWTEGSTFYDDAFVIEGCSIDLRFGQAPIRWQVAKDNIELLGDDVLDALDRREVIPIGRELGFDWSHLSEDGRYSSEVIAPLDDQYLLDIFSRFSEGYVEDCQEDFYQSLAAAQIK